VRGRIVLWLGLALFATLPAAQAQIQIAAVGDSVMEGKTLTPGETFPGQLQAALKAKGYNVTVLNSGRWGDTTAQILSRLDKAVPANTQIAIVQGGGNDVRLGKPRSEIRDNLLRIVERLRARNIDVLLFYRNGLPPLEGGTMDKLTILGEFFQGLSPNTKEYYIDEGHPSRAGYAVVVQRVLPDVERVVARVKPPGM
jgi:acyl-CoA thioesterase-1